MAFNTVRQRMRTLSSRPLLAAAIVIPLVLFVTGAWFDYRAERKEVHEQMLVTSSALAEHAQKVVETADLVLDRVLDRVSGLDWATIAESDDLHLFMLRMRQRLPQIESIFLVDPNGGNVATTRAFPLTDIPMVADRDYFQQARDGGTGLFISAPFAGRLQDGRFDGLAGVTISPAYFRAFYAQVMDDPAQSTAALVRDDGSVLVRYPPLPSPLSQLPAGSAFMRAIKREHWQGEFGGTSSIDGRRRMGAYRRLTGIPLLVSYSINDAVYLKEWHRNLVFIGGFAVLLGIALLLTEWAVLRRTRAELEASRRLMAETERRQQAELALEQMQKMEALGRLTGGVAHDFNNLLTAIMGSLELATKRSSEPRVQRLLAAASQAAQRGAKLTAQMLAFARKREVVVRPLDPNTVIRDMGGMIERTIGPLVNVAYDLDPAATPISADVVQFEVTLLNLCVNARDAMPGGGELVLRTERVVTLIPPADPTGLPPGDYVRVSVTDNGEGMPEAVRARALEPFFTTKEPGKGTGLGLSTAYGFARSAGGNVSIETALGIGTTVSLTLPRVEGTPSQEALPAMPKACHARRLLLVDDDPLVRAATRDMLEDIGHEVVDVSCGRDAIEVLARDGAFDLVATDFAMAGMNGSELAGHIRRTHPAMPILFVTGFAKDDALVRWGDRNTLTLGKPFSSVELARAIDLAISRSPVGAEPPAA
jgi:signal transduction histidine kinase